MRSLGEPVLAFESDRLKVRFGVTGGAKSLGVLEMLRFGKSGTSTDSEFQRRCLLKFSLLFGATSRAANSA
jgi:hypothetical protein